ncbi:hypothetical protein BGX28_009862 [Mortierella sp. GBA30]|nr:hypothetical protein BGX28_009862 [Mortierella sp. GBA30]
MSEIGKWVHNPWYGPSPAPEVPAGQMIHRRPVAPRQGELEQQSKMQDATAESEDEANRA